LKSLDLAAKLPKELAATAAWCVLGYRQLTADF
jgi:hypothetical protein